MPRRHDIGLPLPIFAAAPCHRHIQMQCLRPVRAQLQSRLHRQQTAQNRLHALRGMHELHRHLPARRHKLHTPPFKNCGSRPVPTPQFHSHGRCIRHHCRATSPRKDGGRRPCRNHRQTASGTAHANRAAWRKKHQVPEQPLHCMPAVCGRMPEWRITSVNRPYKTNAARVVLRTRLLPPGMYPLL